MFLDHRFGPGPIRRSAPGAGSMKEGGSGPILRVSREHLAGEGGTPGGCQGATRQVRARGLGVELCHLQGALPLMSSRRIRSCRTR